MNANVARRWPAWRSFVWTGVIGSLLAWSWAWFVSRGPSAVMVFVALAAVVLAYRGTQGNRWALVGVTVCGFAMFLASVYWVYMLGLGASGQVGVLDWLAMTVFPMVAAVVLLLGSVTGFRHASS